MKESTLLYCRTHSQRLQSLNDKIVKINVQGIKIHQAIHSKTLGLNILYMKTYPGRSTCTQFRKRSLLRICALKRVISFISKPTAIKIYKCLLEQRFDYCSVVWDGLSRKLSEKLQKLKNTRAARVYRNQEMTT